MSVSCPYSVRIVSVWCPYTKHPRRDRSERGGAVSAGGFVTDIKGGDKMFETRSIVAGNESIQGQLRKLLANAND